MWQIFQPCGIFYIFFWLLLSTIKIIYYCNIQSFRVEVTLKWSLILQTFQNWVNLFFFENRSFNTLYASARTEVKNIAFFLSSVTVLQTNSCSILFIYEDISTSPGLKGSIFPIKDIFVESLDNIPFGYWLKTLELWIRILSPIMLC